MRGVETRTQSKLIYERARQIIPGGVNSPVRSFREVDVFPPLIVKEGSGSLIRDADGREYIDYCLGWGSMILGHAHPAVVKAAATQMEKGSSFGIATLLEVEFAEKIVSLVPSVERLRLVSSGTESSMTAVRLARAVTGRSKLIKFSGHYHGHVDSLLIQAGSGVSFLNREASSKGIPRGVVEDTLVFPFNNLEILCDFFRKDPKASDLAAVILEPIAGNMGVVLPEPGFLEMLREETERAGALLIFDEVISGFRVGLAGAAGLYGIDPDLTCFGKIIGGGFPLAALGGKKQFLDALAPLGEVYQAGTLSGNPVAVTAGLATLAQVELAGFFENLQSKTDRLLTPIREAIASRGCKACVRAQGSMFSVFFGLREVLCKEDLQHLDKECFKKFFRFLFENGIYIPPSPQEAWFLSTAHTNEQIDFTANKAVGFIYSNL